MHWHSPAALVRFRSLHFTSLPYTPPQSNLMHCTDLHYFTSTPSSVAYSDAMHCTVVPSSKAMQCSACGRTIHSMPAQCTALHCTALPLHCTGLHFTALPCPALPCPALPCPATALHCPATTVHYNPIHCTALQCPALPNCEVPVECGCLSRQALQVLPPGRGLQGLHICPVRGADDVKEGLQLCLGSAVQLRHAKHLPACTRTLTLHALCR